MNHQSSASAPGLQQLAYLTPLYHPECCTIATHLCHPDCRAIAAHLRHPKCRASGRGDPGQHIVTFFMAALKVFYV